MKKTLTILILLVLGCAHLYAQNIPNGGFENWIDTSYAKPVDWGPLDELVRGAGDNTVFTYKETNDPGQGNSSIKIVSTLSPLQPAWPLPGVVGLGNCYLNTPSGSPAWTGIAFANRPDSLFFLAKYIVANPDTAAVHVKFSKLGTPIIDGFFLIMPNSDWKQFSIPLKPLYQNSETPDTMYLEFYSSILNEPKEGGALYLDGVSFEQSFDPPVVSLGTGSTVCTGSQIIFDPVISGGTAPYSYRWNATGAALSCTTCQNPSALIDGNSSFSVTITDYYHHTASATVSYTVSQNSNPIQLNVSNTHITCANPDTTTIHVSNGAPPYNYFWSNSEIQQGGNTESHIYQKAGIYVISVSDAAGCITSIVDTVLNHGILVSVTSQTDPVCNKVPDGEIVVSASGAIAPYTYMWSNGTASNTLSNIRAQVYELTVNDAAGCSAVYNYMLEPQDGWGFHAYAEATDGNCSNNGSVQSTVEGGVTPYTYLWSNSEITPNIANLDKGYYTVTISDALGCITVAGGNVHNDCVSIISGRAFYDSNNNCQFDAGEDGIPYRNVIATGPGNNNSYGYTDANGNYSIQVPEAGSYKLQLSSWDYDCPQDALVCGTPNNTLNILSLGDTLANTNISLPPNSAYDLAVSARWNAANPGFVKTYSIIPYYKSYYSLSGQISVTFAYDTNLVYLSSSMPLPAHDPVSHTLTWTLDSANIHFWSWYNELVCNFQVPVNIDRNTQLTGDVYVTPIDNDCDTLDNHLSVAGLVTGSFDPNEKTVEPAGRIYEETNKLTYTIHFQNTGNDSTWFVIIVDTLSPDLDPATVRTTASSHPYSKFDVSKQGILTWEFKPLRLVDSMTNPEGSKGFVQFTINKKVGRSIGSVISNKAEIYFDYNEAVVTNTVYDTVSVRTDVPEVAMSKDVSLSIQPNPASDHILIATSNFTPIKNIIYDINGNKIMEAKFANNINTSTLPAGIYLLETMGTDTVLRKKFVIQ